MYIIEGDLLGTDRRTARWTARWTERWTDRQANVKLLSFL